MKKLYLMLSMLFAFGTAANAVPAKKLQKVITLANGAKVSVELRGDEYLVGGKAPTEPLIVLLLTTPCLRRSTSKRRSLPLPHVVRRQSRDALHASHV